MISLRIVHNPPKLIFIVFSPQEKAEYQSNDYRSLEPLLNFQKSLLQIFTPQADAFESDIARSSQLGCPASMTSVHLR